MDQFIAFNQILIDNKVTINLLDYVKRCNFDDVDMSFIDTFIELVFRDDFCIPHTYLKNYGVYKLSGGSSDLEKRLKTNGFKKDVDYRLRKKVESTSGGCTHYSEYMLKPDTFKKLLIRSTKCEKYANYYIYLERCIKYYNDYQLELNRRNMAKLYDQINNYDTFIIPQKDDKIDELIKKVDTLCIENKTKTKQIEELITNSKETHDRLTDVEDELVSTSTNLEITMSALSIVQDKLDISVEDRAVKPFDKNKINKIVILKSIEDDNIYYLTCGQKDSVNRATRIRSKSHTRIDTIESVSNSIYLFGHIKKELDGKAKVVGRIIELISIDGPTFIDEIKSLFDGRRIIDLTKKP